MAARSRHRKHSGSTKRTGGHPAGPRTRTPRAAPVAPATAGDWIDAARLRTLPLAVSPVIAGTGAAVLVDGLFHWALALACLAVAVLLQIGVNYANDYSDGIRGTDDERVGPARLTALGKARPHTVLIVALVFFALAAVAGLAIVIRTQEWWLLLVGAAAIVAAWFYTGGKRPYGYMALGEVFVFVFFGLVATLGTTWVQVRSLPQEAWFAAVAVGLLAVAVLLANNLRDIDQDRAVGKRTLSTLIGRRATQALFTLCLLAPFGIAAYLALFYPIAWLVMLALLAGAPALLIVWTYRAPRELVVALALTSVTSLAYSALLAWAFIG
ncbi:1,4-dihydroxy-2-naphthoate polyprenyltransferase [Microbacterium sp. LRZ72]|uniref:1,4-dihydroxy-2-naphthoate polyprenyltransferase n=1 Tax=Microbacterium sp. LRZ72 TaxID=2942481 RepID=UPI0029ADC97C|nr:1,4-dihydroxy-2-naphthoate polyprenyltransferase [Microbacterium sp. LRZ72]MDX2377317.1 1,4-dihydroxy-2-naphthoate polyprenyltransferase [Microbacterium sp. LRZ72]